MNMVVFLIIAGAAIAANAVYWFRKGLRNGDLLSRKRVEDFIEDKTIAELSLNEAASFKEFQIALGRDPSHPYLVMDINRRPWNGKTD